MKSIFPMKSVFLLAVVIYLIIGDQSGSYAQKAPINFNDYHGYTQTVTYLKKVAQAYPNLTELIEIGKSTMGRPIYVLVISNMKTGTTIDAHVELRHMRKEAVQNVLPQKPYQGKPGHWLDGALHGNEYTGSEVCLYIIDKLVSGYGSNEIITQLVDNKTFYICPVSNPDGVYNSAERGIAQRQNSMMIDDDGDGRINEDGPDDLNGDGYITQFRYKDPQGQYVIDDVDPRLMVRLGRGETTDKQRYSVAPEDKDNDGDGRRSEDTESGIDLNRNFPEKWFKDDGFPGGSGDYPTSAPETRAIAEFFTNHKNIILAQCYHTSGGFTYRPASSSTEAVMHPKDVAIFDLIMGKKYLELIGDEIPQAWQQPDLLDQFKEELKETSKDEFAVARGYEMPRAWVYNRDGVLSFGVIADWMHLQQGTYAVSTELWNSRKDMPEVPAFTGNNAGVQRSRFLLKYQDEKHNGKFFVPWKSFNHPELGPGEIGGWIPQYNSSNNAFCGEPLKRVCEIHWQFELFRAQLMPEVVISEADAKVIFTTNKTDDAQALQNDNQVTIHKGKAAGIYKIVEVTVTVENQGQLPTHVARGAGLAGNREDVVWLIGDRDKTTYIQGAPFQKIGVLEGKMKIPGYPTETITASTRLVKWLVALEGDAPLKVVVTSQKGGTKVKNLTVK